MQSEIAASIVHAIPGRIRVRLDRSSRSPDTMRSLADAVSQVQGMREVQINPNTGSLLLLYDPDTLGIEDLYLAARAANVNVALPDSGPQQMPAGEVSAVAGRINSTFAGLDGAIANLSGGKIDARTLVPLGLAATAVRRIVASGANLGAIPWYVLLWYSYEMFTKYNLKRTPR